MDPIEKRELRVGDATRPALHKQWTGEVSFLPYQPVSALHNEQELTDWLSCTEMVISDLEWLLGQPCHVFWSHLIFDDSLRANLDSFLKSFPREFDGAVTDDQVNNQMESLYKTYFKIFVRTTTCKESSKEYLSPEVFGAILYENYILDIPKIIDLCVIFSQSNEQLLSKMIGNVFKHQLKYLDDIGTAIPSIIKLFEDLIDRLTDNKLTVPRGLTTPNPETCTADVDILDLSLYASDLCHSLASFLRVYPPACNPFHSSSIYKRICSYYEDVLCRLLEQLRLAVMSEEDEKKAYKRLKLAQEDSVYIFRQILYTSTLGTLVKTRDDSPSAALLLQEYYDVLTEALGETRFIGHYSSMFPFADDSDIINQLSLPSDNTRLAFIRDGLAAALAHKDMEDSKSSKSHTSSQTPHQAKVLPKGSATTHSTDFTVSAAAASATTKTPAPSDNGACASTTHGNVQSVIDLFPHLGAGFVELCLNHYHSVDQLVSAILEATLPDSLANLDHTMAVIPDEHSLVTSRRNVFDNDAFDIFRNKKIDTSKVHKGKRSAVESKGSLHKEKTIELVSNFDDLSLNDGRVAVGEHFDDFMYDDEYDDTYDANEVGADDADEALELMGRH